MRFLLFLGIAFFSVWTTIASACDLPLLRTSERPGQDAGPLEITSSFIVLDILGVDDANQQIELDMRATFTWVDRRLEGFEGCRFNVTEVWFPTAELLNSSELRAQRLNARNQVEVGRDGSVKYVQRFTGRVSSNHNLRDFPFDSHAFQIDVASLELGIADMVFIADGDRTILNDRLNIEGWNIEGIELDTHTALVEDLALETSVLRLTINAERSAEFYIYRVILLIVFVVGMSWSIFWVPPNRFEFQIGLGATSMLTAIAFNLSLSSDLPTLGYLTALDKILVWAIVLIFLSIVEALYAGLLVLNGKEQLALKIDKICRVMFPAALFLGWSLFVFGAIR